MKRLLILSTLLISTSLFSQEIQSNPNLSIQYQEEIEYLNEEYSEEEYNGLEEVPLVFDPIEEVVESPIEENIK